MITEDYVSFETAKRLKEKGFDERVKSYYTESGLEGYMLALKATKNTELESYFYARPTIQMAMKWLREKYNIDMSVHPFKVKNACYYQFDLYTDGVMNEPPAYRAELIDVNHPSYWTYSTYEEACEAAIKYCLENLI